MFVCGRSETMQSKYLKWVVRVGVVLVVMGGWVYGLGYFSRRQVVYGGNSAEEYVARYRADCERRGGWLNECGSDGNATAVCVYKCEIW